VVGLYYSLYKEGSVNVFALSSSWLTVVMAVGRYVAVCRPLHARGFISLRGTRAAIGAVFGLAVCFNIPRLLRYQVITSNLCQELLHQYNTTSIDTSCHCVFYTKVAAMLLPLSTIYLLDVGLSIT
jgi:hypothetical protein